jgi:glycosyltransferase
MKVSIITTCYNRAETIGGAIESVLAQDYPDIEYIVVDGASKDGSVETIRRLMDDGRWKKSFMFISEPDHGMYEAINKGIRMSTGDIIGLVHSDDMLYDEHVISDMVAKMEATGADFFYGDGVYVNAENIKKPVRNWIGGPYYRWKVACGWLPLHPTCYIRRDVMMREGLYDESYKIAADTDLLVRYLYKARLKVVYMKRKIIRMRMGGLSTDSEKRRQMWNEDIRLYKEHGFWATPVKIMKMMWKVPQFVEAKFMRV